MNRVELNNKIKIICKELIEHQGYICSLDVLYKLNYLSKYDIDAWRFGKILYLEKVFKTNLGKLSFINRTIKEIAKQKGFKPSWTAYNKYGKGEKPRLLFSKSGNEKIEMAYATHYIDQHWINKLKQDKKEIGKMPASL